MTPAFYGRGQGEVGRSAWAQGHADFQFAVFQTRSENSEVPASLWEGQVGKRFTAAMRCHPPSSLFSLRDVVEFSETV